MPAKRLIRITWVELGTNNAACLGFDETFESDDELVAIAENLEYRAENAGIDLSRYWYVIDEEPLD
jgi:hypothetical protein